MSSTLASALCEIGVTPQMAAILLGLTDTRIAELLSGDLPTAAESTLLAGFLGRSPADLFPRPIAQT